ncbi:hypothetical protein OEZ85_007083 [Tetradesmus obliquus]|uniref:Cationic amino acid transporter C-terminal domain-containing protein n=1 Tax=Tetradesmus obliquus TaxID=3088 RepID=A0ABY8TWN4_TETOB|nr:hypothetical protein OEZ85_007083 [Tetradesmus obliquus]
MKRSNSKVSETASGAGSFLWHGPTWMNRMGGEMPHQAPKQGESRMKKVLGLGGLTMMSTAAIIGSGIFVLTGVVAKSYAGPGVVISYLIGGVVAVLSAMCYMEFAAETSTTGASIVYSCKIFGKFVAWLVAINVLIELVIASAAVATGFSGYLSALIKNLDLIGPNRLSNWNGSTLLYGPGANGNMLAIDPVAAAAVLIITALLVMGVQQAEWVQNCCTSLCLIAIIMSIITGAVYSNKSNWADFAPMGFNGIFRGASVVFFAYLGFEMMAAAPEEAVNARRDVPLGIGISVVGCTILYLLMALVITGMVPWQQINASAPFAQAFKDRGAMWMSIIVSFGGLAGILDTIVVTQYSMSRTFVMLGRMGLVPPLLSRVHPKTQTPIFSTVFCGLVSAVLALFVPIGELADLTSLGALFAFCVVASAVMFRRYYQPPAMPRDMDGFTGREGAPLWQVLIPFLSIIGASLGLAFSWATGCHYGVYIAMFAWWLIATVYIAFCLPVVFMPTKLPTPLFPWWPSATVLTTIFLIASLGPTNWARWGYACIIGVLLFAGYALAESLYNRRHGPPPPRAMSYHDEQNYEAREGSSKAAVDSMDVESGKAIEGDAADAGGELGHDQAASSK